MDATTITLLTHPYQLLLATFVLTHAARAVFSAVAKARTNHANERIEVPAQTQAA
jgi:hypothetical protein